MIPLVSVILPTHNRCELLPRAINSVLDQTYENLECIVVNDASTDNTRDVVSGFDDGRVKYVHNKRSRGAAGARNRGIKRATGEYIAFLDDDDEWHPEKLEKQVDLIQTLPKSFGLVYCWMDYYDDGILIEEHHPELTGYVFPDVLDEQRLGGCPTLLVRRSVVEEIGGFDASLPRGNDGDFIRRICLNYKVDLVPKPLVKVHVGHDHTRITREDKEGIENAILGQRAKLEKFGDLRGTYPDRFARVYMKIAHRYAQLGDWRPCLTYYSRALRTRPFTFLVYIQILRSAKKLLAGTSHE